MPGEQMIGMFVNPTLQVLFGSLTDPSSGQTCYMLPARTLQSETLEECFADLIRKQFGIRDDGLTHTIRTIAIDRRSVHIVQCHIPEDHPILSVNPDVYRWLELVFLCDKKNKEQFLPDTWKLLVMFRGAWAFHNEPSCSSV